MSELSSIAWTNSARCASWHTFQVLTKHADQLVDISAKRDACAVFIKQLGRRPVSGGADYPVEHPKGGDMKEWPADLCVREYPAPLITGRVN